MVETRENGTVVELSPAERERRGVSATDVRDALRETIETGSRTEKVFEGCTLPELDFDYETLAGANRHPVVFRDCTVESVSAANADVQVPVRFEGCTVEELDVEGARFEDDVTVSETTVTGEVNADEARFDQDADFTATTFAGPVSMDEASFGDDTSFADATFEATATFRAAVFRGSANEFGDNADFTGATFEEGAAFRQTRFEDTDFGDAGFGDRADFEGAVFDGDADFAGATFAGETAFDDVDFAADTTFGGAAFRGPARFRGAVFEGGARVGQDDAAFVSATFHDSADFSDAQFRYANFTSARFDDRAAFEDGAFDGDADFPEAVFAGRADFDEVRFGGDAEFTGADFERVAVFRGATFEGASRHRSANAVFEDVTFADDVDFDEATFTSANFRRTRFGGVADFSAAHFEEAVSFHAEAVDAEAVVDFTDAVLKQGTVTQPAAGQVWYDLTGASVGDVTIAAEQPDDHREILDYVRFCNTEFDEFDGHEFDFAAHTDYFDRRGWTLHEFDGPEEREYALPMSTENVETTYLKAKKAASTSGYVKAAGEFRVKRQQFARRKHLALAADGSVVASARLVNLSRAAENAFLDVTCGYGMRLGRILLVFLLFPLFPALLFAFGGPAFRTAAGQVAPTAVLTGEGLTTLYENLYFSYITFLTIGYGDIGPKGALARLVAGLEVYLSVVLGGLVLYALVKRSEV